MNTTDSTEPAMTKHLHVVLDEATYQHVRSAAFEQQRSIGEIVRQALTAYLMAEEATTAATEIS